MNEAVDDMDDMNASKNLYARFRDQLEHEDGLYNQRITWTIAFQALICISFIDLTTSIIDPHNAGEIGMLSRFRYGIAFGGLIAVTLTYISCAAAHYRITQLKARFAKLTRNRPIEPSLDSDKWTQVFGFAASQGVLWLIFGLWLLALREIGVNSRAVLCVFGMAIFAAVVFQFSYVVWIPHPENPAAEPDKTPTDGP